MGISLSTSMSSALVIGACCAALGSPAAWSQEQKHIHFTNTSNNSRYVQQHVIDAGDVPGHQVRIFEIHWVYPKGDVAFDGVRVQESSARGFSDYINGNGPNSNYTTYVLEDGNKIFSRNQGAAHTTVNADGSKNSRFFVVETLIGGTGKFRGIRGILRSTGNFDPKAGWLTIETDGDYWIEQ